jgi:hypothetical protein
MADRRIKRPNWFKGTKKTLQDTIRKRDEAIEEFNINRENIETKNRLKASRRELKKAKQQAKEE